MVNTQLVSLGVRPGQAVPDSVCALLYITLTLSMAGEYTPEENDPYWQNEASSIKRFFSHIYAYLSATSYTLPHHPCHTNFRALQCGTDISWHRRHCMHVKMLCMKVTVK